MAKLPTVRVGSWARITSPAFDLDLFRSRLTIQLPTKYKRAGYKQGASDDPDEGYVKLYREVEGKDGVLYIPRALPLKTPHILVRKGSHPDDFPLVDWPKDKIKLGPNKWNPYDQGPAWEALSAPPDESGGRILVLGCGKGKTVLANKFMMSRYTPTAIIVDSYDLAQQWVERIRDPKTGPGYDPLIIQGTKSILRGDWIGEPVCVFVAQTLMQREAHEWPMEFRKWWGLSIFDELHVFGAPVFSRVVPVFLGERLGLTATIDRLDGLDVVFRSHLAPKPCYADVEQVLIPKVRLIKTGLPCPDMFILGRKSKDPKKNADRYWSAQRIIDADFATRGVLVKKYGGRRSDPFSIMTALKGAKRHSIPLTISKIANDVGRNKMILRTLRTLEKQGRTVLVLGSRTTQLAHLHKKYKGDSGLVHGKIDRKERMANLHNHPVVFMAQKIGTKGLDRPAFDTLVLLVTDPMLVTPANSQQGTGRIQRPVEGKKGTRVYVFVDEHSLVLKPSLERYIANMRQLLGRDLDVQHVTVGE